MSIDMDQAADAILQAAKQGVSNELTDDSDGTSSLSDIEYRDSHQDEEAEASDDHNNESDDEDDSEAETERLEESPNKIRTHQNVVLSSHKESQIYSPSKLNNQILPDEPDEEEDDDPLSDEDISLHESPKSSIHDDADADPQTAATSLEDSSGEGKRTLSAGTDTRKRKRSIMAGSGMDDDLEEPSRKRTGSVMTPGDDYAIEDEEHPDEEGDISNPISGEISGDEGGEGQDDEIPDVEDPIVVEEDEPETVETLASPKKRGRKKKKTIENGINGHADDLEAAQGGNTVLNGDDEVRNGDDENAENEGLDEVEAALKNEEEMEKKRVALDQLGAIERQFATFRDRLYDERLEHLNREEGMLKQEKPTHPEYLAMMQCIDARRDEKLRINDKLREYELQTLRNYAVARRSQILTQFQQEVRELREKKLEQLGKQWYEIQHDRRSYAGSVPDYTLKFPTDRSQQVMNQVAYSNEVSILSGVAKYIGFPAAPPMATATDAELEEDLQKMGRARKSHAAGAAGLPFQELAALRTAGSTSRFKPAEEQFIEQTPWANPQHPSHAHLLQRQTSAQQLPRTTSPFSQVQARRHSHQHGSAGPISGTFSSSSSSLQHANGLPYGILPSGRVSPHNNPFSSTAHAIAPSPLGSRQTSLSPQISRPQPQLLETQDVSKSSGKQLSPLFPKPE